MDKNNRSQHNALFNAFIAAAVLQLAPSVCYADTASDIAKVELDILKQEYRFSQIPKVPSKDLNPAAPAAPSLNATADKNEYALANGLAKAIVAQIKTTATPTAIMLDDGNLRSAISTYKALLATITAANSILLVRHTELQHALTTPSGATTSAIPAVAALATFGLVVEAAAGFAQLFKTQYSFNTSSQMTFADAALNAALTSEIKTNFQLVDLYAKTLPCVDKRMLDASTNDFEGYAAVVCAESSSYLLAVSDRHFKNLSTSTELLNSVPSKIAGKPADDAKVKDILAKKKALQDVVEASYASFGAASAVDKNGSSSIDVALRVETIMSRLNKKQIHLLSSKVLAADSDIIVDTRWYRGLKVTMESVALATWQLSDGEGTVLTKQFVCRTTGRDDVPLREGAVVSNTVRNCTP